MLYVEIVLFVLYPLLFFMETWKKKSSSITEEIKEIE